MRPRPRRIAFNLNHYGVQIECLNPVYIKEIEKIHASNPEDA